METTVENTPIRWHRKITKAHLTMYVGLPVQWTEAHNLQGKDAVWLELLSDGSLRIVPEANQ
jgi:hypothetical protein